MPILKGRGSERGKWSSDGGNFIFQLNWMIIAMYLRDSKFDGYTKTSPTVRLQGPYLATSLISSSWGKISHNGNIWCPITSPLLIGSGMHPCGPYKQLLLNLTISDCHEVEVLVIGRTFHLCGSLYHSCNYGWGLT